MEFDTATGHFSACQGNEVLPRGTTAIRLSLDSALGPRVTLRALRGKRLLTSGERGAGWTAADVTIPVKTVARTAHGVNICFAFLARYESVGLIGERVPTVQSTNHGLGLLKIEYLKPGDRSWWSLASSIAAHMTFGHAWSGAWLVFFLIAVMGAILLIISWLAIGLER